MGKRDHSPQFYRYYPRLFHKYFQGVESNLVNQLSQAGYFYYHSTLLTDALIDDRQFGNLPAISMLQEQTVKMLTSIYGKNSEFWDYWNQRRQEYFSAVEMENKLDYSSKVNLAEFESLADKKSAFGKIAIDCLYLLSNKSDEKLYNLLLRSHYFFSVGFQLYDDVKDFKEDFTKGQFNWGLYQLRKKKYSNKYMGDVATLNKLFFINGIAQKIMQQSIEYFRKAIQILEDIEVDSEWKEVIFEMQQTIERYLDFTDGYIKTIERRVQIQNNSYGLYDFFDYNFIHNKSISHALDYIKDCYLKNFSELKHIMYLSTYEGFDNSESVHVSDIFQRALVNDCLLEVCEALKINASAYFTLECEYLIGQRNTDKIGAWSYFPSVKEIAADIDDLGQIMQLFINSGHRKHVKEYCQNAIDLVLRDRVTASGGIETWIIPQKNRNKQQEKQEQFNTVKWGKGPDVEVVANFIYALSLYDTSKYDLIIRHAIRYIVKCQNPLGFWESRWYYGNYYGTYVCLRILKEYDSDHDITSAIQKALEYLLDMQNEDGGFSLLNNEISDALSTSLAVLSLKLFFNSSHASIRKATGYLLSIQNEDGCWEATNFIRPKALEPYKSKVLTSAFVLKALVFNRKKYDYPN